MSEVFTAMVPVRVQRVCDSCGIGEMLPTGLVMPTHPAQFKHECTHCKDLRSFLVEYPYIKYMDPIEALAASRGETAEG